MQIMDNNEARQMLLNIVGGVVASFVFAALTWFIKKTISLLRARNFKEIFGKDSPKDFHLVYGKMNLKTVYNNEGQIEQWPYMKPGVSGSFNISTPVSFAQTKSAKYISESIVRNVDRSPILVSDDEIREKVNISYCSVGGTNNFKTLDVLDSEENTFFKFTESENQLSISDAQTGKIYRIEGKHDYGFIIKVIPKSFPDRVWIAVAGLGEWGTSGAAWFLANKWQSIKKIAGSKEFGVIIRTEAGKDESAKVIDQKIAS